MVGGKVVYGAGQYASMARPHTRWRPTGCHPTTSRATPTIDEFGPTELKCSVCTAGSDEPFAERVERLQDFALYLAGEAEKYTIILTAVYFPRSAN